MASPTPFGLRTPYSYSPKRCLPGRFGGVLTLLTAILLAVTTSARKFSPSAFCLRRLVNLLYLIEPQGQVRDPCIPLNETTPQTQYFTSQADITKYLNCTTVYDSIVISTTETTLSLPSIGAFVWNLKITHSPYLTTISAPNLASIGQDFVLDDLPLLVNLNLSVLESAGRILWTSLPSLQEIPAWKPQSVTVPSIPRDGTYERTPRFIISHTALAKLDYFALPSFEQSTSTKAYPSSVLAIMDNRFLDKVDLGGGLEYGPKNLTVTGNSKSLVLTLSEMLEVENATFSDLSGLSVPVLERSSGTIILRNNSLPKISFPVFEYLPGSLVIEGNDELTELEFPKLSSVGAGIEGDLRIVGNERLEIITGFDILMFASGSMEFRGNFSTYVFCFFIFPLSSKSQCECFGS